MRAERTDLTTSTPFAARMSVEQVEEGLALAPKFDADGLIPCITTDANTGDVLMLGYMNGEALQQTIAKFASTTTRTPSGCAFGSLVLAPAVTSDTVPASTDRLSSAALPMDLPDSCSRSQGNPLIRRTSTGTRRIRHSFEVGRPLLLPSHQVTGISEPLPVAAPMIL